LGNYKGDVEKENHPMSIDDVLIEEESKVQLEVQAVAEGSHEAGVVEDIKTKEDESLTMIHYNGEYVSTKEIARRMKLGILEKPGESRGGIVTGCSAPGMPFDIDSDDEDLITFKDEEAKEAYYKKKVARKAGEGEHGSKEPNKNAVATQSKSKKSSLSTTRFDRKRSEACKKLIQRLWISEDEGELYDFERKRLEDNFSLTDDKDKGESDDYLLFSHTITSYFSLGLIGEIGFNWVLLWSLKMLNSKLVISLSKSSFLALKTIICLISLRSRDLDQNVKMSDQSNA